MKKLMQLLSLNLFVLMLAASCTGITKLGVEEGGGDGGNEQKNKKDVVPQVKGENWKTKVNKTEKIGLLATLRAKPGKEKEVKALLLQGLGLANEEVATVSWFAFQINETTFGIYDTFEVEYGRQAHLKGEVVKTLSNKAAGLLEDFSLDTSVQTLDVIAANHKAGLQKKGFLLIMKAQKGKSKDVEDFLNVGKGLVNDEPGTLSWYGIKLGDNTYGVFDTFADDTGRDAHLDGKIAEALVANAANLLVDFKVSDIQKIDILGSK